MQEQNKKKEMPQWELEEKSSKNILCLDMKFQHELNYFLVDFKDV